MDNNNDKLNHGSLMPFGTMEGSEMRDIPDWYLIDVKTALEGKLPTLSDDEAKVLNYIYSNIKSIKWRLKFRNNNILSHKVRNGFKPYIRPNIY